VTEITWAPQALEDVEAIRDYLSRTSASYATLLVERIVAAVTRAVRARVGLFPSWHTRPIERSSCATIVLSIGCDTARPRS
jgi:plasmid stabilization system protein ParE